MADQERSDFHVVFTVILCDFNFCIWYVMKLIFMSQLQMVLPNNCLGFESHRSSDSKVINVAYNLSAQRIMVKTT